MTRLTLCWAGDQLVVLLILAQKSIHFSETIDAELRAALLASLCFPGPHSNDNQIGYLPINS